MSEPVGRDDHGDGGVSPPRRIIVAETVHLFADVKSGAQAILATVTIDGEAVIVRVPLGEARLVWPGTMPEPSLPPLPEASGGPESSPAGHLH